MTTPTAVYGWQKPDPTEYADIDVVNTALDAMDTSFSSIIAARNIRIRPLIQMKLLKNFTVFNSATPTYLTSLTSTPAWEVVFSAPGNVGGFTVGTDGFIRFTVAGIYKLNYRITVKTVTTVTEGWYAIGLYDTSHNLIPRTYLRNRMQSYTKYQTFQMSTYIKAASSGGDALLNTAYQIGITQDSNLGGQGMLTDAVGVRPYENRFDLEYVRTV